MLIALDNLFPWFGDMVELGGEILVVILLIAALIWTLLFERLWYLFFVFPGKRRIAARLWGEVEDHQSWRAQHYRRFLVERVRSDLERNLSLIQTLIKVCPLLGLLGTVIGMLEIFDAIAISGSSNPRTTAGGISKATVTTMAGMVVAISSLVLANYLVRGTQAARSSLNDTLRVDDAAGDSEQ